MSNSKLGLCQAAEGGGGDESDGEDPLPGGNARLRPGRLGAEEPGEAAQGERQPPRGGGKSGGGGKRRHHGGDAKALRCERRHQPAPPETELMILTIGRNMAMTIVPTTSASTMMSAGSMAAVMPATALSTSSS